MAKFEKGKGSRKRTVEVLQRGRVLSLDETDGPSEMLTGYRTFASDAAARAALKQEAVRLIQEGLTAADEDAKKLAAELTAIRPATKKVSLPIRQDIYVYNEATGFMFTSQRMAGKAMEDDSAAWGKAIKKGDILPVSLIQDDPFIVRVVLGDELSVEESSEWVARIDWHLNVKDGKLCITGGAPLFGEDYEPDDSYSEQFIRTLEIPKGHYRATVFSYVPGINGSAVLDQLAGGHKKAEPIGRWFRQTRAGEEFPAWLREWCIGDPRIDPGHEKEWQGIPLPDADDSPEYVHFVLQLNPVAEIPKDGLSEPPSSGWFAEAENARKPEQCPKGIEAHEIIGHNEGTEGSWLYAANVRKYCTEDALGISGGPVILPLTELALVFWLPWFCSRLAVPTLQIQCKLKDIDLEIPEGVMLVPIEDGFQIIFSSDLHPSEILRLAKSFTECLQGLPDGSFLEFFSAQTNDFGATEFKAGMHRYSGEVRDGCWHVVDSFPKVGAAQLKDALSLAREVEAGAALSLADAKEGEAIKKWANENFKGHLGKSKVVLEANSLRLEPRDPEAFVLFGVAAFAVRFSSSWPVVNLSESEEEDDDDAEGWDLAEPPKGLLVFEAPSGRSYFQTMALLWAEALAERIQKEEPKLKGARFKHVGDLLCDQFSNVVIRAYAQADGATWAVFLIAPPNTLEFELSSMFSDGAVLTSGRNPQTKEDPQKLVYCRRSPDAGIKELIAQHQASLLELQEKHGNPLLVNATSKGLAEFLEASLLKNE